MGCGMGYLACRNEERPFSLGALVAAEVPPRKKEGITMDHDKSTADVRCRLAMHVEHRGTMVPGVTWGPLDGTRGTRGLTVLPESS